MKQKFEYSINILFSKEDECYIATVPELGKYISAFGDTYEEALKEIQTVIELTLESYREDGITPPKPKQVIKAM